MKKIKLNTKLNLNKNTVSILNPLQLGTLKGGLAGQEAAPAAPVGPVCEDSGCSKTGGCKTSFILNCGE